MLAPSAADASVRPARPGDTRAMGAVQLRSWRRAYADVLPAGALAALTVEQLGAGWEPAVTAPPSARHAVLVACSGPTVIGLAAVGPSTDGDAATTDAELVALEVDPAHQRAGHGSRLLAAVAQTAREQGFTALRAWTSATDDARRAFLESAGLRPDGGRRRLGAAAEGAPYEVREIRLAAALPD